MPFASYKSIGEVAKAHQVSYRLVDFVQPLPKPVSEHLQSDIDFALKQVGFAGSEFAACENLIYPVIKEVWKWGYLDQFMIWSHMPLDYDGDLCDTPDYFVARRSPLGNVVIEEPYMMIVEAKKDDFERGWGQCLAAMLAAHERNGLADQVMFGITTNGRVWEFGRLQQRQFLQNSRQYVLADLAEVCAAVNYMFDQCRLQLVALVPAK